MIRLSPVFSLYLLGMSIALFMFLFILDGGGLVDIPPLVYQIYGIVLLFVFFWWPLDLIIHWEKRSEAERTKDRILFCLALSAILFVYPYFWFGTPLYPTLAVSLGAGLLLPGLFGFAKQLKNRRAVVNPGGVFRAGMESPRAKEFLKYFPEARQYVMGFTDGDGDRAHLMLHGRKPYPQIKNAQIDYVLDIGVDRKSGRYLGGKEQLQTYIFVNDGGYAGVGFLPSANIGRALDYGFTDEEIDKAIEEANRIEQRWGAIGEEPIPIQRYYGRYVRMK